MPYDFTKSIYFNDLLKSLFSSCQCDTHLNILSYILLKKIRELGNLHVIAHPDPILDKVYFFFNVTFLY